MGNIILRSRLKAFATRTRSAFSLRKLARVHAQQRIQRSVTQDAETTEASAPQPDPISSFPLFIRVDDHVFNLFRIIGEGATSQVVLAMDMRSRDLANREVAVKVIRKPRYHLDGVPAVDADHVGLSESDVKKEIEMMRRISRWDDRFLGELLYVCQDRFNCYLIMPLYPQSLADRMQYLIKNKQAMPKQELILYTGEITLAIEALHSRSICHCDIKPLNIMITRDGHIRLVDFGVAESTPNTDGMLVGERGTDGYMPPEQASLHPYDPKKADVYSFGVVFLQMALCPATILAQSPNTGKMMLDHVAVADAKRRHDESSDDLALQLIAPNPSERPDISTIRNHRFLRNMDWEQVTTGMWFASYRPTSISLHEFKLPG